QAPPRSRHGPGGGKGTAPGNTRKAAMSRARIGLSVPPQLPPADISAYARRAESAGFDELWLAEDCFFAGGIAAISAALSSTRRLVVGLGIMPAVARNAAFTAMEIAAVA